MATITSLWGHHATNSCIRRQASVRSRSIHKSDDWQGPHMLCLLIDPVYRLLTLAGLLLAVAACGENGGDLLVSPGVLILQLSSILAHQANGLQSDLSSRPRGSRARPFMSSSGHMRVRCKTITAPGATATTRNRPQPDRARTTIGDRRRPSKGAASKRACRKGRQ